MVAEQELGGCPEITGWNSCTLPGIVCETGVWSLDPGDYLTSNQGSGWLRWHTAVSLGIESGSC